jgi:hypothetical protein
VLVGGSRGVLNNDNEGPSRLPTGVTVFEVVLESTMVVVDVALLNRRSTEKQNLHRVCLGGLLFDCRNVEK